MTLLQLLLLLLLLLPQVLLLLLLIMYSVACVYAVHFFFFLGGGGCFCLLMIFILYIGIVKHVVLIAVNVILLYKSPLALLPLAPSLCHCSCVCFFFLFVSVVGSSKYRVQTESWQTCTQSCDLVLC